MTHLNHDTPVFVIGFPRSGTSLVADMLERAGLFAGECVEASPDNRHGFFENKEIRETVIKGMLTEMSHDPLGISSIPTLDEVREHWDDDEPAALRETVETMLAREGWDGESPWMLKNCKLVLLWPLFAKAWPHAHWVFVQRPTMDIMQSCLKTKFMKQHSLNPGFWAELIDEYYARIEELRLTGVDIYSVCPHDGIEVGDWSRFLALFYELGLGDKANVITEAVDEQAWHGSPEGMAPAFSWVEQNVDAGQLTKNVRFAMTHKIKEMLPAAGETPTPLAIVCGGPSLVGQLDNLKSMIRRGTLVLAVNGTHDFLLDHGIRPRFMAMMDARDHNVRFLERAQRDCLYLIASHCAMKSWALLKRLHAPHLMWHCHSAVDLAPLQEEFDMYGPEVWGGSTIGMKCFNLGIMMGFFNFHLFGMDACLTEEEHHAYDQVENDGEETMQLCAGEKWFTVTQWMLRQATDFQDFYASHGSRINLTIWGEGLIRHIVREGIKIDQQEEHAA